MNKIKQYWWVIFVILIAGFAFYWIQIRPSQIIKNCIIKYPMAFETPTEKPKIYSGIVPYETYLRNLSIRTDMDGYQKCLRENGLKI